MKGDRLVEIVGADVVGTGSMVGGKYVLGEPIGEGGMGTVYRATHSDLHTDLAIKLMHPGFARRREHRLRFAREARVAATLHHPNAVTILDYGEDAGTPFLVMELLVGETLGDALDRAAGQMPLDRVLELGVQVADVLVAVQQRIEEVADDRFSGAGRVFVIDKQLRVLAHPDAELADVLARARDNGVIAGIDGEVIDEGLLLSATASWPYGARRNTPTTTRPAPCARPKTCCAGSRRATPAGNRSSA